MINLEEGLRVITTKNINTIILDDPIGFNRQEVETPGLNGQLTKWIADVIPVGTEGTVFRFRTINMVPCCGGPHYEMWGIVWDGLPRKGMNYGVSDGKNLEIAVNQQNHALKTMRDDWLNKLKLRREQEEELAKAYRQYGPYNHGPNSRTIFNELENREEVCQIAQKIYDEAANLPLRKV